MKILITVCARGGSKGVPGKNVKTLAGLPLIAYSIQTARKFQETSSHEVHLGLSTDSPEIREIAAQHGLGTEYLRPDVLATDKAGKFDAIDALLVYEEAKSGMTYDCVIDLDVTSPLRTVADLEEGLELLTNRPDALNLFSVNHAHRNPYFNMVEEAGNGFVKICKEFDTNILCRQDAPRVYDLNGSFYCYKRTCFDQPDFKVINDQSLVYLMPHVCFDVDTPTDFLMLEYFIQEDKLGFDL